MQQKEDINGLNIFHSFLPKSFVEESFPVDRYNGGVFIGLGFYLFALWETGFSTLKTPHSCSCLILFYKLVQV